MNKKIISYSLWGDSALYCDGAILNIDLAKQYFPDWTCRFYIASDCSALKDIKSMDAEVIIMPPQNGIDRTKNDWKWNLNHCGMFWRNFVIDELELGDIVIFRDCDSLLSEREVKPIDRWLESRFVACRFIENQTHYNSLYMGGMWGIKGGYIYGIQDSINGWIKFYKTLNHPYIFIDLEYYTNILGKYLYDKTISFGYNTDNPLPHLKDGEQPIGWVFDDSRREQKYFPKNITYR